MWLFASTQPYPETVALCEYVQVHPSSVALLFLAQRLLWPYWVALSIGAWTGSRGQWLLKLAPFLIPPFRALLLNRHGDFFQGTPGPILAHCGRGLHDGLAAGWNGFREALHNLRVKAGERLSDGSRAFGFRILYIVGILLRGVGYPHCRLFHRMHGDGALDIPAPPSNGIDMVPFDQHGTHWDAKALEKLARSTSARWILWRQGPQEVNLPRLDDAGVFAVSEQPYFRGWKPSLFPMASFRTLQPGEISEVLAPLSHSILVDRRKLLALGIPRCGSIGTAWMILFWKAAAAGWHSYSVGQTKPIREQPDAPLEETSFLVNLLLNRQLRAIGPRRPELSRGTIGFVRSKYRDSGRAKVLLVSPFLPYPLSHGGAVRIFNLCRSLADRVDFSLVAIREKNEFVDYPRLREVFCDVHVVDIDERPARDSSLPAQVRQHQSASLRSLIAELASEWRPDLLQVEYTHMASFGNAAPDVPAILVEHDLTFSLYRQLADAKRTHRAEAEYRRWREFERRWLREYDAVWTVSGEDRQTAIREGGRDPNRTFSIPNGVDVERFLPAEQPGPNPELLYVGSFRHLPNLIGFEKLLREVMPRLWRSHPEVRLRVVAGPRHETFAGQMLGGLDPRIEIHGFVEDLRPLYAKASVVVVPLEVSAGTNIKVLEAMAAGKAVVSTPVGCAGLGLEDGRELLIRPGWEEFAQAICILLENSDLRSRISRQARAAAEANFSWRAIADRAFASYYELVPKLALRRSPAPVYANGSLPSPVLSRSVSRQAGLR